MKQSYLINGKKFLNRKQLHDYLIRVFNLPEYYGRNLDALWDCLSSNQSIKKITIIHLDEFTKTLCDYSIALIDLLTELSKKKEIELKLYTHGRINETRRIKNR